MSRYTCSAFGPDSRPSRRPTRPHVAASRRAAVRGAGKPQTTCFLTAPGRRLRGGARPTRPLPLRRTCDFWAQAAFRSRPVSDLAEACLRSVFQEASARVHRERLCRPAPANGVEMRTEVADDAVVPAEVAVDAREVRRRRDDRHVHVAGEHPALAAGMLLATISRISATSASMSSALIAQPLPSRSWCSPTPLRRSGLPLRKKPCSGSNRISRTPNAWSTWSSTRPSLRKQLRCGRARSSATGRYLREMLRRRPVTSTISALNSVTTFSIG